MEDTWEHFYRTGSVEDYLKYRASVKEECPERVEEGDAGFRFDNRNDTKVGTCRGI